MVPEDVMVMKRRELRRLEIVKKTIAREVRQKEAGMLLDISERQVRRVVHRVREEGEKGVVHRLRGRSSNRKKPEGVKERILKRYRDRYGGFGPTLACEKLMERDGIKLSVETMRQWMMGAGLWAGRRQREKHRQWRERKSYFGEMVQMDGSHHDWFEGRGEKAVLMGYIDDATGNVHARFYEYEGTIPAMDGLKRYIRKHGIPQSLYLDKHTTYKSPSAPTVEEELEGKKPLSEFERACEELGIRVIHAHSPQAKGRIERLFGTFQDRVVKEMRLKGIQTIGQANMFLDAYLPVYNRRFGVLARVSTDLHGKVGAGVNLDRILCIKVERKLRNDWTVVYDQQWYQVTDPTRAKTVALERRLDGTIHLYDAHRRPLRFKAIAERPPKPQTIDKSEWLVLPKPKAPYRTPPDHPWRKSMSYFFQKNRSLNKGQKPDISKLEKIGHF